MEDIIITVFPTVETHRSVKTYVENLQFRLRDLRPNLRLTLRELETLHSAASAALNGKSITWTAALAEPQSYWAEESDTDEQ